MTTKIEPEEQIFLLKTSRQTIAHTLRKQDAPQLNWDELSSNLKEPGACFVTLTKHGELRGCVGSIEAIQPLIEDVRSRSLSAAFEDPRFPPLRESELDQIQIEISILTKPQRLVYDTPRDLPKLLHPGVDGVILQLHYHRATFLPQVWDKLPDPEGFLDRLCLKMGLPADTWRNTLLEVEIYHVDEFSEKGFEN